MTKVKIKKPKLEKPSLKSHVSNIWTLTKKELKSLFNTPTGYVIAIIFIFIHFVFFFYLGQFFFVGRADLTAYFIYIPFLLLFILPALTMGAISTERKEGTIEYLLTKPIGTLEFISAKIKGTVIFFFLVLLLEFIAIGTILLFGDFDLGKLFAQYIAVILMISAMASFGVFISSLLKSQISAYLITFLLLLANLLLGIRYFALFLPISFVKIINSVSLFTQYDSMMNGSISFSTIIYFIGFIALFITLTYLRLLSFKLPIGHPKFRNTALYSLLAVVVIALSVVFGQKLFGGIDFTQNKINSLSEVTEDIIGNLEDEVIITVYYSDNVPLEFEVAKTDMFNLLAQYDNKGNDNLKIVYKSTVNEGDKEEGIQKGIETLTSQSLGSDNYSISEFYQGITFDSGENSDVIRSVSNTNSLEYQMTSIIRNLTIDEKITIGILNDGMTMVNSSQNQFESMGLFLQELGKDYELEFLSFETPPAFEGEEEPEKIPVEIKNDEIDALIVPGPNSEMSNEISNEIRRYFNDGGSVFFMVEPVSVDLTYGLAASKNPYAKTDFFADLGVEVNESLMFDLGSHDNIQAGNSPVPIPYPPFAAPLVNNKIESENVDGTQFTAQNINGVLFNWGGWISYNTEKNENVIVKEILRTTEYGGEQDEENYAIDLNKNWGEVDQNNLNSLVTGVTIEEKDEKSGRAVVISDSQIISDYSVSRSNNMAFSFRVVEWLTQSDAISTIKAKDRIAPPLQLNPAIVFIYPVVITVGIISLIIVTGIIKIYLRKREMKKVYR